MKPLLLAVGCAALGVADLAWIDLALVPQALTEPVLPAPAVVKPAPIELTEATPAPNPTPMPRPPVSAPSFFTVHFDIDQETPTATSTHELEAVARLLADDPSLEARLDGYADRTGPPLHNETLSCQRAAAVATVLADRGIDRARMAVAGHGAHAPVARGPDSASMAQNRRVEIHVENRRP